MPAVKLFHVNGNKIIKQTNKQTSQVGPVLMSWFDGAVSAVFPEASTAVSNDIK